MSQIIIIKYYLTVLKQFQRLRLGILVYSFICFCLLEQCIIQKGSAQKTQALLDQRDSEVVKTAVYLETVAPLNPPT